MEYAAIAFAGLLALAFAGVPLGLAMLAVGVAGFSLQRSVGAAFAMSGQQILDLATNYDLSTLPMFLLMGALIHRSNLSEELYNACNSWIGHRKGLAMATIAACGGFAAVSGSSMATAATMGRIALPSMRRFGYADSLATATVASGGTLGILIPPSVPMVVYGLLTQADIGKMFVAGIIPGCLMIAAYLAAIGLTVRLRPSSGPRGKRTPWAERWRLTSKVWGIGALFTLVLGVIYFGICTPTEAAGIGSTGALIFTWLRGRLTFRTMFEAVLEAGMTTTTIFVVMFGALVFANFLTMTGLVTGLVSWIHEMNLSPMAVIALICLSYIVLGCVFESLGMMLVTVPIFYAIIVELGMDPIWFGIVVVIVIEIGLITPPVGMNVFVVKSVIPDVSILTVYRGILPFFLASLAVLILIVLFPQIALFLPSLM